MAASDYFDWPGSGDRFVKYDTVRSVDANNALDAVSTGFGKFPTPAQLWGATANIGTDTGAANAYVASIAETYLASLTDGLRVTVRIANTNTGASTFRLNGIGAAVNIVRPSGTALSAGDLQASMDADFVYHTIGPKWMLMNVWGTGAAGAAGNNVSEPYSERTANSIFVSADSGKKIKITGAGSFTQTFSAAAQLGDGWRVVYWNASSGLIQVTADALTYYMWPGEIREFFADTTNSRIQSIVRTAGRYTSSVVGAGTIAKPPGYRMFFRRVTGSGAGGNGGGGGGSGRGLSASSGSGGSGGGGGSGGQCGQSATGMFASDLLPATFTWSLGDGGAGGAAGTGGAGASSGGTGNNGNNGSLGSAGNASTFLATTDVAYASAAGGAVGAAGVGNGGTAGVNNNAGGAASSNTATLATTGIGVRCSITSTTINGGTGTAGTNQTSAAPGTAGGAGGDESPGYDYGTGTVGTSTGGGSQAALGSAGNNATAATNATRAGVGGMGGGGGGGSAGVGAGADAVTGAGGNGAAGAKGGPGEVEIIGII